MTLTFQQLGRKLGRNEYFDTYIVAAGNDTTNPALGKVIDNRDGRVKAIFAQMNVTNKSGTSPTAKLRLKGGLTDDSALFQILKDTSSANIETAALDISTAQTTTVVGFIESESKNRSMFPPFLALDVRLGGTTPGWTGTVAICVVRN